jgi:outer membrane protein OmpA-like peptidoglycan-associated protein
MKSRNSLRFIAALITLLAFGASVRAATYYVVVASFSNEHTASRFATSASAFFPNAAFTFDAERSVYHVYAMRTDVYSEAENFRVTGAARNGFANSWIFANFGGRGPTDMAASATTSIRLELYSGDMVFLSPADGNISSVSKHDEAKPPGEWGSKTPFTFAARNRSGLLLSGKVSLMRGKEVASTFKTGDIASFGGQQGTITLVCEVAGYSPVVREVDMRRLDKTPGVYINNEGVWEIAFAHTRMKSDEISLLFHGLFHENASVMHPSSRERLDVLASLMRADREIRISINSHCNPRTTRDIRAVDEEGDIFNIDGSHLQSGSDKQLTKLRAEYLRDYLVASGVRAERISVLGWGHLKMIVTGAESDHSRNDRVEVSFALN